MDKKSRLLIAHFIEPKTKGEQFNDWPLHMTIIPWFQENEVEARRQLAESAEHMRACRVLCAKVLGKIALFGIGEDVPVRPVKDCTAFGVIHGMLLDRFYKQLEDNTYIGGAYNPHLTINKNHDPGENFEILVDTVSLVRHDNVCKTIIENYNLLKDEE